jgi:hypothetical protein
MGRFGRTLIVLAVVLAVAGAALLLVVPEQPAIGLGLGVVAAILIVVSPRAPRTTGAGGSRTGISRRGFLVAGVAVLIGGAAAVRRGWLVAPGQDASHSPVESSRVLPQPGARPAGDGIWLSPDEIAAFPTDTDAFRRLEDAAGQPIERHDLSDQDSPTPGHLMQLALLAARLDDDRLRGRARDLIVAAIGTEDGDTGQHQARNRPLGIGRNLPAYVISADVIGLDSFDPATGDRFRSWLDELRSKVIAGVDYSLVGIEPVDHSNWGAHMGAALTAANLYLHDSAAIRTSADILRGWLGERAGRQDWEYDTDRHDYSWMCAYPDVDAFLPVNPAGCERDGMAIGGIIPIDMQRGDGFRVPPRYTQYPRETLQARTAQAELLYRAGFDTWAWADSALRRIAERQLAMGEEFDPDWYEPRMGCYWIIARRTGVELPLEEPSTGRSVFGVDWTHAAAGGLG